MRIEVAYFLQANAFFEASRTLFIPERDREFNSPHVFGPLTFCIGHALELTLKLHLMLIDGLHDRTHDLKSLLETCIQKNCFDLSELDENCLALSPITSRPLWQLQKARDLGVLDTKDGTIFNLYTQVVSLSQGFFKSLAGNVEGEKYLARYPSIDLPHHKFDIELVLLAIGFLLEVARVRIFSNDPHVPDRP